MKKTTEIYLELSDEDVAQIIKAKIIIKPISCFEDCPLRLHIGKEQAVWKEIKK